MPSFETLANKRRGNVLKMTTSALFVAPMSSPVIEVLFDQATGEMSELPEGYQPVGWVDGEDGITWGRETDVSEVIGHGSAYPVRSDITKDSTTVQAKFLETRATTLGLYYSIPDAASKWDSATGQVVLDQALTPPKLNYRFVAIGRDGAGADAVYVVRHLPAATITEYGEQTWNNEDSTGFDVTLTAEPDETAGFAVRNIVTGPGLTDERLQAMGFTTGTTEPTP